MFFLSGGDTHRGAWVLLGTGVVVPGGQAGEVAHPFRRNGAFASDKTRGPGVVLCLIFLPHPQAFVDSWVCHCMFCSDVHCFSPVVSLLLAPNFVRCI